LALAGAAGLTGAPPAVGGLVRRLFVMVLFFAFTWLVASLSVPQAASPECATRDTCRAQALIAEAAGDFERFHDLSWRAVQKGKGNDPELMVMLARAMALSGRPGDAIVMLSRLADMGVKVDASGEEFRVVRTLKEWPDVEAKLAALNSPVVTDAAPPAAPAAAPPSPPAASAPPEPRSAARESRTEATAAPESGFSFSAPDTATSGLAYDAVSRRFLVSDRHAGKLMVIDEVSHHVVPLVSAAGAGFYNDVAAFRIDARRGDLWVVSSQTQDDHDESVLHKLQLVSGRPIFEVKPESLGDVRLVDVSVDDSGTVYALDAAGDRILRLRAGSRALELVAAIKVDGPTAFDVIDERTAFVAGSAGVSRVDLASGKATLLDAKDPLTGVTAVDAHGRSVYLLQQSSEGGHLVRCKLDRNERGLTSVTTLDVATAIGRSGDRLYYVAAPGTIKSIRERP
jgi:hypothetical protein